MIAQAFHFTKRVNQERPLVGTTENYTNAYNWNGYLAIRSLSGTRYFCLYDNDQMKETVIFFF